MEYKNGLQEALTEVSMLSRAEERQVYVDVGFDPNKPEVANNYKAIWNIDKNHLESIQTSKYALVQHTNAFLPILNTLEQLNKTDFTFRTSEIRGRAYLDIVFPEMKLIPADNKEILIGFRAINSYSGTLALRLEGFGLRTVCSNGMTMKTILGSFKKVHLGSEVNMLKKLEKFIFEDIGKNYVILNDLIVEAIEDKIENREQAKLLLEKVGFGKTSQKKILEQFEKEEQTRFGIYNAITYIISHEKAGKAYAQGNYENKAEIVLATSLYALKERG